MAQEKPYRLSFYESGYIKPEEFERRNFAEDAKLVASFHIDLMADPKIKEAIELLLLSLPEN